MPTPGSPGGAPSSAPTPAASPKIKTIDEYIKDFSTVSTEVDDGIDKAFDKYRKEKSKGRDKASQNLRASVRVERTKLQTLLMSLPSDSVIESYSLSKEEKKIFKNEIKSLKGNISAFVRDISSEIRLGRGEEIKEADESSPEKVNEKNREKLKAVQGTLGTVYEGFSKILKEIEVKAHKGSLTDSEKSDFSVQIENLLSKYYIAIEEAKGLGTKKGKMALDLTDKVQGALAKDILKIRAKLEDVPVPEVEDWNEFLKKTVPYGHGPVLKKVLDALEHSFDEFAETRNHLNEGLDKVEEDLLKVKARLEEALKKDKKLDDADKEPFINELDTQEAAYVEIGTLLAEKVIEMSAVGPIDRKTTAQISELERRLAFTANLVDHLKEKVDDRPKPKDQRENARQISERVASIEKQVKEEGDKRDIGKAFDAGQKSMFLLLIDAEEVAVNEAYQELSYLDPSLPENQPTVNNVLRFLNEAEQRLAKLKESVDKKRVAKEKEVMEKLEAAEKVIEGVEDKIRQINMEEANGKLQMNERKDAVKEKGSLVQRLFEPFVKYQNGLTYHDQKNVNESLSDPKEDITKAREWINDMPESNEKEIKLKKKLMKKARRMMRRRRSAMIRYFFRLPKGEMAKLGGDAMFTRTLDALLGF